MKDLSEQAFKLMEDQKLDELKALLKDVTDIDSLIDDGMTLLTKAAWDGDDSAVIFLLDAGANINGQDSETGDTALMLACLEDDDSMATILLDRGADLEAKNHKGETSIFHAVRSGKAAIVEFLLDKGCNIDAIDNDGNRAIDIANDRGFDYIADLINKHSAKLENDKLTQFINTDKETSTMQF